MPLKIIDLEQIEKSQWFALWQEYLKFYQSAISDEVSEHTWQRLTQLNSQMYGFAAVLEDKVVGIVHMIEHDSCWTVRPYAYLQDLFIDPNYRRQGIANHLIQHVYGIAKQRNCDRVYWLAQQDNHTARRLYDRVAKPTGFVQYRMSSY